MRITPEKRLSDVDGRFPILALDVGESRSGATRGNGPMRMSALAIGIPPASRWMLERVGAEQREVMVLLR